MIRCGTKMVAMAKLASSTVSMLALACSLSAVAETRGDDDAAVVFMWK